MRGDGGDVDHGDEREAADDDLQADEIRLAARTMGYTIVALRVTADGEYRIVYRDTFLNEHQLGPAPMERIASRIYLHGLI